MKRTVRNGLAIAGMAGGMLFLGQAVASATEGEITQTNTAPVVQTVEDQSRGPAGSNDADVDQNNELYYDADANAGDVGVNVGIVNAVGGNEVNAGSGGGGGPVYSATTEQEEPKPAPTTTVRVTFDTAINNEVNVDSTITNSGNAAVTAPNVTQTNTATVDQHSEDKGKKGKDPRPENGAGALLIGNGGRPGGNDADIDQDNYADIDLDADAGDVGVDVDIENEVGGNTVNCWGGKHSTVTCDVTFDTTINNTVNIHSIICGSGNAVIGTLPSFVCNLGPAAAAPAAPAAHHMKPAGHHHKHDAHAPKALSSAQPSKGSLASTGADVSAPLTLGLLALGAGGALSLAGRRRQTTTV